MLYEHDETYIGPTLLNISVRASSLVAKDKFPTNTCDRDRETEIEEERKKEKS